MIFKTRRKGALLVMSAPLLFMFSGLFLANTIRYPVESLPYRTGSVRSEADSIIWGTCVCIGCA
jgi:hypothetical protein